MDLEFNIGAGQWPGDDTWRDLEARLAEDDLSPLCATAREAHTVGDTDDIRDGLARESSPPSQEPVIDEVNSAIEAIRGAPANDPYLDNAPPYLEIAATSAVQKAVQQLLEEDSRVRYPFDDLTADACLASTPHDLRRQVEEEVDYALQAILENNRGFLRCLE